MDEKTQYPKFWLEGHSNNLTHCASIYGCQGFETEYAGIVWGRDLVWRDGVWSLGDNCEDSVAGLKDLFYRGKRGDLESANLAIKLLKNRYRILLTRGIRGTYIFCENPETASYLRKLLGGAV
jgi:DUF2075 family protein